MIDVDQIDPGVTPPTGLFTPDASPFDASTCPADPSPLSMLHVRVRTSSAGGRYAPRNVGAIWVEHAGGGFVKTIERWGSQRARWLTRFAAASGNNLADAITGATLTSHVTHERVWNLTDVERCEVANGAYQIVIEMTDKNGTGPSVALPFDKSAAATIAPAETANFHDLELILE